jgi:PilZ domain
MGEKREESRRIRERVRLELPVRVRAMGATGLAWEELTRLLDISPFGARLSLSRPVEPGRLLHLTMPLPRPLRSFDHAEEQYRVWSLVRNVRATTAGEATRFEVGLAFIGKRPPAGHLEDPEKLYDVEHSIPGGLYEPRPKERPERSDATRLGMAVEVEVTLLDERGGVARSGVTVTENLSRRGAAVYAPFRAERGDFVLLRSAQFGLEVLAAVRACRTDERGVTRLHLEFLDREWPLEGLE